MVLVWVCWVAVAGWCCSFIAAELSLLLDLQFLDAGCLGFFTCWLVPY